MTVASGADDRTAPGSPTAAILPPATSTAPGSAPSAPRSSLPTTMVSSEGPGDTSHRFAASTADDACPWRIAGGAAGPGATSPTSVAAHSRPSGRPPPADNGDPSTTRHATP